MAREVRYPWRTWNQQLASPVIEFRDVSYRVAGTEVLSEFNLQVRRGETLVLLGRSGSGKTTSLKLVNRLLSPTSGEVRVKGVSNAKSTSFVCAAASATSSRMLDCFPISPSSEILVWFRRSKDGPRNEFAHACRSCCRRLDLPAEMATRYPHQLSGGQRQRVGVARALAADPEILLMDEPFGALDPLTRDELQREFLLLQQRLHKTVVFVTHDLREALRLGSRIALMEAGRLVTVLSPAEFLQIRPIHWLPPTSGLSETGWSRRAQIEARHERISIHLCRITDRYWSLRWSISGWSGFSTLFAMLIGIPLGIAIAHRPRLNKPVLASANIIQTIPSLALFGFLLPVPWLGERADRLAILALTLYALLPIIRNTYTGIRGVDPAVVEAGRGMGLTESQLLFQVELPLAVSVILSGVRVAVVISVGLATIAAAIGAGGLGEFIFRGLAMVDD